MIPLGPSDTLAGVASVASKLTFVCGYMNVATNGFDVQAGSGAGYLPNAAATQLTAGASGALVRSIHIVNTDSSSRTFTLYVNGTGAANTIFGPITLPAGYSAVHDDDGWGIYDTNGARMGIGATGAAGSNGTSPGGTIWLSAAGMWPSTTSGATAAAKSEMATNDNNLYVISFADGATSYCEANLGMPVDWDEGTITARFFWTCASTPASKVVRWQIQAVAVSDDDPLDVAYGTEQAVDDTLSVANDLMISAATAAVTVGGTPQPRDLVMFKIARLGSHGNDTMGAAALLIGVMLEFTRG